MSAVKLGPAATPLAAMSYYQLLGVAQTATAEEIERAFRGMLDLYAGVSLATFGILDETERRNVAALLEFARDALCDNAARQAYDAALGSEGVHAGAEAALRVRPAPRQSALPLRFAERVPIPAPVLAARGPGVSETPVDRAAEPEPVPVPESASDSITESAGEATPSPRTAEAAPAAAGADIETTGESTPPNTSALQSEKLGEAGVIKHAADPAAEVIEAYASEAAADSTAEAGAAPPGFETKTDDEAAAPIAEFTSAGNEANNVAPVESDDDDGPSDAEPVADEDIAPIEAADISVPGEAVDVGTGGANRDDEAARADEQVGAVAAQTSSDDVARDDAADSEEPTAAEGPTARETWFEDSTPDASAGAALEADDGADDRAETESWFSGDSTWFSDDEFESVYSDIDVYGPPNPRQAATSSSDSKPEPVFAHHRGAGYDAGPRLVDSLHSVRVEWVPSARESWPRVPAQEEAAPVARAVRPTTSPGAARPAPVAEPALHHHKGPPPLPSKPAAEASAAAAPPTPAPRASPPPEKPSPAGPPPAIERDTAVNGAFLAKLREAAGLTVDDIVRHTRISKRHIDNLESDRLSALPPRVYVRGYVRMYAKETGVNADKLADAYLRWYDRRTRPAEE